MKCPSCRVENPDTQKFCGQCGTRLERLCPKCGEPNPREYRFCGECGYDLRRNGPIAPGGDSSPQPEPPKPSAEDARHPSSLLEGERKYVTALFSDMSGYTAMSEKLDPEELKEVTRRIFGEISKVVGKYDGFIEKYAGDAVMALFGVPRAHEDDPIRAIKAALEIHELVGAISPEVEDQIGQPISMHTGINTGLVVTGEVDMERGTHGVAGDTINLASRLSSLAKPGEMLVDADTCRQAEGHFTFEALGPRRVKGKAEPVHVHKVLSPREEPVTMRRLSGLRAELVGRKVELAQLREAVENLREGKGRIFSICGDAGTGKSRLVEEFKATLDLGKIQWVEGHAYAYSQNMPYFPLIDLLNRVLRIEEGDPPGRVKEKVESNLERLLERSEEVAPYIGGLYALSYPEVEGVSPEFWKSRLFEAVQAVVAALSRRGPVVICLEDIHWADPSSLELLRFLLTGLGYPALFLCVYRLPFSLFAGHQLSALGKTYEEIRLQDLSASETQDMMGSLLESEIIPTELRRFVHVKAEGNPFYVEEVINSLVESGTLIREDGEWKLSRPITERDTPSTIQGIISARLDRLEKETKRVLQEASVIGRAFFYDILTRISELKDHIDRSLRGLEQLDLIRTRSFQPELEYIFKHALTQEVVYNGLLKKERQQIHERIALVMEQLFKERLPEFYETLAFHFKQGRSIHKAVDYLMKSGEKSLRRYAVEESHQYYREAFDLLNNKSDKISAEKGLLVDLLNQWAYVFYYRGDFKTLTELLVAHERLAESLDDKARLGMFYGWHGMCLWSRERFVDSYHHLRKALELGEALQNEKVIGYACTWLTWTCAELGRLDEAIHFGERAQEICRRIKGDNYLYLKSLGGMGHAYWFKGERRKALEAGKALIEFGQLNSNIRSMVMGHYAVGCSHLVNGDYPSAIASFKEAIQVSVDPYYSHIPRLFLGMTYVSDNRFSEAEDILNEVVSFSRDFGTESIGTPAKVYLGVVAIAKGQLTRGMQAIATGRQSWLENRIKWRYAQAELVLGKLYAQIEAGAAPLRFSTVAKNIGFLLRNVPSASQKAEEHFTKAISMAKEIGARAIMGQAYLDLGLLHRGRKRNDQARKCISEAIQIFQQCEAEIYLKQAKEALVSIRETDIFRIN